MSTTPYLVLHARRSNLVAAKPWRRPLCLPNEDVMSKYLSGTALQQ